MNRSLLLFSCFLVTLLLATSVAEASSRPRWHTSWGAVSIGENRALRDPTTKGRYVRALPAHSQLPIVDFLAGKDGVVTRELTLNQRGRTAFLRFRASGWTPLEQTHPSDPPPRDGPLYVTRSDQQIGGIAVEWWNGLVWEEGSSIALFRDRIAFIVDGHACVFITAAGLEDMCE